MTTFHAPRPLASLKTDILARRTGVVTGGTYGIGRAIVERLAMSGARVFYCAPSADGSTELQSAIEEAGGVSPVFVRADVGQPNQLECLIREAACARGAIDILVNNAAVGIYRTAEVLTLEEWQHCWDINVRSCWLTARYAWPYLKASGTASIINISSVHARHTSAGTLPYAPSKAAISALTRSLAIEGGRYGIRANAICPGLIRSHSNGKDFTGNDAADRRYQRVLRNETLGRIGLPEDVSGAALFLAGPDSSFITGSELFVDGGAHARLYGNVYEQES